MGNPGLFQSPKTATVPCCPPESHLLTDRTQEVAGSSPASSIKKPLETAASFSAPALCPFSDALLPSVLGRV
jgi:hypothetical protein